MAVFRIHVLPRADFGGFGVQDQTVEVEGIMITKADGKKLARPLHSSTLLITKLNLTDKWRRKKLESGLSETAKKEIEKEAAEQLKDLERQKAEEEQKKKDDADKNDASKYSNYRQRICIRIDTRFSECQPNPQMGDGNNVIRRKNGNAKRF